ncbi:MAG: helix-turn-helix domain-containing protein [Elusimicrobiota bacterium]
MQRGLLGQEVDALGNKTSIPLLNASQAARHLNISQRQLYRYIEKKRLRPAGKFLTDWLFKEKDIADFVRPRRGMGAHMPTAIKKFFWSHPHQDIDPSTYARFTVTQLLQYGDSQAVHWTQQRYGLPYLKKIASSSREIDARTKNFWALL